jgi:stage V sporulation protein G
MNLTEVRIRLANEQFVKAYAFICFDDCFLVHGIRIIKGPAGLFISFANRTHSEEHVRSYFEPLSSARSESSFASPDKVQQSRFQIVHRSGDLDHAFGLKFCEHRTLLANVGHRQLNIFLRDSVNIGAVLRR